MARLVLLLTSCLAAACARSEAPAPTAVAPAPKAACSVRDGPACKDQLPRATVTVEGDAPGAPASFVVEVVATPESRERGLMWRDALADDAGMLFVFPRREIHSFWMKNTRIPLDMLFIDDDGRVVGVVENAEPHSLASRRVESPSRFVLEVAAGTCRRLGLRAGAQARLEGALGLDIPRFGHAKEPAR